MLLRKFNKLPKTKAMAELEKCCGAGKWCRLMMKDFPFPSKRKLLSLAKRNWFERCKEKDYLEAFEHHPKIGDVRSLKKKFASTSKWAGQEQASVQEANDQVIKALAKGNKAYEKKFGYIFIVCATGKTAEEMLALLEARLNNEPEEELKIAMGEQHKITLIRIEKLLQKEETT